MAAALREFLQTPRKAEDKLAEEEYRMDEAARDLGFSVVPDLFVLGESIIRQLFNVRHLWCKLTSI